MTTQKKAKSVQSFAVSALRKHCQELFGVRPEVFDGAFFDAKKNDGFTKNGAKKKIESFLKRKNPKKAGDR